MFLVSKLAQKSGLVWLWLSLLLLAIDFASKTLVVNTMAYSESINLLPVFSITYVHNYGAAYSFLSDAGGWQRWLFTGIAIAVCGLVTWWLKETTRQQVMLPVAFCLIIGGALGNVFDRLLHGFVIDFLVLYYQDWYWPAFNVADSAICLGAFLLVIDMFKNKDNVNE